MSCSLKHLEQGRIAVVSALKAPPSIRHRLMELGFVPGATVRVVMRGTPALIHLHGGRVSLSSELAEAIQVRM